TRDNADLERFLHFGFFVGAAFQIQDDLLNLVGDPVRYGKERDGDLWEGKRTLMIVHLLNCVSNEDRSRLQKFLALARHDKRVEDVCWVRQLLERHGSLEYSRQVAHGLAGAASREFDVSFAGLPETRDLQF